MKSRIALLLLIFVSVITNVFATTEVYDTVYLDCSEQTVTTIISKCSCQTDSSAMNNESRMFYADNCDSVSVLSDNNIIDSDSCSDYVSFATLIVNDFNNILSEINNCFALLSIIIGVFGILIAVFGLLGFHNLRDDCRKIEENTGKKIDEQDKIIADKIEEFKELKKSIEKEKEKVVAIQKRQDFQNEYLLRINQYLFSITNSVVDSNGSNDGTSSSIRESLFNQYYIIKAFLPWSDSETDGTEAAFRYLQVHGIEDNIVDLQFIADKDPDIKKKRLALETIGYIRASLNNVQKQ